jgi:hypothetical protein
MTYVSPLSKSITFRIITYRVILPLSWGFLYYWILPGSIHRQISYVTLSTDSLRNKCTIKIEKSASRHNDFHYPQLNVMQNFLTCYDIEPIY